LAGRIPRRNDRKKKGAWFGEKKRTKKGRVNEILDRETQNAPRKGAKGVGIFLQLGTGKTRNEASGPTASVGKQLVGGEAREGGVRRWKGGVGELQTRERRSFSLAAVVYGGNNLVAIGVRNS